MTFALSQEQPLLAKTIRTRIAAEPRPLEEQIERWLTPAVRGAQGVTLTEIAPGLDLQSDILAAHEFCAPHRRAYPSHACAGVVLTPPKTSDR